MSKSEEPALTRRDWLAVLSAVAGLASVGSTDAAEPAAGEPFRYGLNTSTIRGQELGIVEEANLIAETGYRGIEPWIRELDEYAQAGGSLKDLGRRFADLGLAVESVIGFFEWAVDDEARRQKGFDEARRSMEIVRQIGGKRLAAPPVGATDRDDIDLRRIAERYRALLELGDERGVVPQVEVWGFSKTLGRLGEAAMVAIDSGHASACILPDVYHLYKGGSSFDGLSLLSGKAIHVFHMNDYPADPPRSTIKDADRVYPGDGIAPLPEILRTLRSIGFNGMLSLELFHRGYWEQDARVVLRTGLEKMKEAVRKSQE